MDQPGEHRSVFARFGVIRSHHAIAWVMLSGMVMASLALWQAWQLGFADPTKEGITLALWLPLLVSGALWLVGKYPAQRRRGLVCARCNAPTATMMSNGATCVRCRHVHSEQDCKHLRLIAREMHNRSALAFPELFPLGARRFRTLQRLIVVYFFGGMFLIIWIGSYAEIFLRDFDAQDFLSLPWGIGFYAMLIMLFLAHRRVSTHAKESLGEICAECGCSIADVREGVKCPECGHVQTREDVKWLQKWRTPSKHRRHATPGSRGQEA